MTEKDDVRVQMAAAGEAGRAALDELLVKMTPAQREGAAMIRDWIAENYAAAGYKQLLSKKYGGFLTKQL